MKGNKDRVGRHPIFFYKKPPCVASFFIYNGELKPENLARVCILPPQFGLPKSTSHRMSISNRFRIVLLIALVALTFAYFSFRDTGGADTEGADKSAVSDSMKAAKPAGGEVLAGLAAAKQSAAPKEEHGESCNHCAKAESSSADAQAQLLTNPAVDPVFKKLEEMEPKVIPADTFDFLKGSQEGERVNFKVGELDFRGTVALVRENHPKARSYGINLDEDFGRVLVKTDAEGAMSVNLFFTDDSRVMEANTERIEGMGEVLKVSETTIDSVLCATSDTIMTREGLRSISGVGALKDPFPQKEIGTGETKTPSAIPVLESLPDSEYVIFLDFDGATITGTGWNFLSGVDPIKAEPLPNASNDTWVNLVWERVVEYMSPFNINVTTDEAVFDDPDQDPTKRLHVVITSTTTVAPDAGGVAFLYSFREDTPVVWAFNDSEYGCAVTITHEAGHAFGLEHDGLEAVGTNPRFEYYPGHNGSYAPGWAPIMGASFLDGFYDEVNQWSIGDYANSTNTEDDLAIIGDVSDPQLGDPSAGASNGFGFKADDHADTYNQSGLGTFEIIGENTIQASGLISTTDDVDVFAFSAPEGKLRFVISPIDVNSVFSAPGSNTSGATLAVDAQLLDSQGQVVAEGTPSGENLLTSFIETSVPEGNYLIAVEGGGRGDNPDTGFSDYGSLGQYNLVGELALPPLSVSGGPKQTTTIFNESTEVGQNNGTDFGFTTPNVGETNTFILENNGESVEITDLSVSLAGGSSSQFQLGNISFSELLPGAGNFIDITYNPRTTGTHSETVIINYEAGGPQTFEFRVRGSATNSTSKDNYEDNNSSLDAYDLNDHEGVWLEDIEGLAFFLSDQKDYYTFTAEPEDELIIIDTLLQPDAQNVRFSLKNFWGTTVATNDGSGRLIFAIPENYTGDKRKFYIYVSTTDDNTVRNAYDLRWSSVELTSDGDDLYEENDSLATAFDLTGRGNRLSEIFGPATSADEDWYKIDVDFNPFTRMLYVAALFNHAEGNIDIEVYRGSSLQGFSESEEDKELVTVYNELDFNDFPEPFNFTPEGNFLVMGVEPGTYYIRVYGDFAGNNYDLIVEERVDDAYEEIDDAGTENDTQLNAYPLGEEIVRQWLSEIDGPGTSASYPEIATEENFINNVDPDWYSFSVPGADPIEELTIEYRAFNSDEDFIDGAAVFELYDSSGELIASTTDDVSNLGFMKAVAPVGRDFFLQVRAKDFADALSGYDFRVDFSVEPPFNQEPVEDNYEENDNFMELYDLRDNEGRYLSSVDGYGTQLDPDWFEIAVPENASKLEVSLVFVNDDGDLDLTLSKKNGPVHFTSSNGTNTESIIWDDPIPGAYALTVTGERNGNFYNLLWDITFSEDNYEENDSLAEAFDLTEFENRLLSKLDGIAIQADDDWYKISADADTVELRAEVNFRHAEGDIDLALYNAGGSLISRSITTSDNEELVYNNPPRGDYYLRVYFGNQGNEYDLSWAALSEAELEDIPEGDDSYEENDSIGDPYVLGATETRLSQSLGLAIQKDEDWYQFEVPENNVGLRVEAIFDDSRGDIDLELYDPLGFPVAVRDSVSDNELLELNSPVPPGVYLVRIYGPNLGNEYDLYLNPYIEDIYEENDVAAEAYDINLLLGSPLSNEGVPTQGDEDWFSFNVSGDRPFILVELSYENLNGAIDFELLDSSLNTVAKADSLDDFDSVSYEASEGTYYVRVYGDDAYNPYDLEVSVIGDDEYEENDTAQEAFDITELPTLQAVQFDDDWYQFEVTDANSFLTVRADFNHENGNVDVFLYSANDLETPIGSSTSNDDNEALRAPGVAGTYYIKVVGDDTNQAYQLSWEVSPDDEFEQNDTLAEATNIAASEGEAISALQYDQDWYEISVAPGKLKVVIDLIFEHESGDLNLTLYDSSGAELLVEDSETDNEQISYSLFPFGTAPETYYIKVDGDSVGTEYELIWQSSIEDNFEGDTGNNTYFTASEDLLGAEGRKISQTIGYGGALDDDWYQVRINPGDQGIVIEALFEHAEDNNIDLELFGANQIFLRRSAGFSDVERINFEGAPGTYYLRVFGTSSGQPYDLVWNSYAEDNLEIGDSPSAPENPPDNDSPDFPRALQGLLSNFQARGSSDLEFIEIDNLTQLDEDWYLFEVLDGEDIFLLDLGFDHNRGDIDVALYDRATGTLLARSETESDGESLSVTNLPPGQYLICVYGFGIYNPKSESDWVPGSFDPYTEDYNPLGGNPNPGESSYYELDDNIARSLGNTYTMRWISTTDDEYDVETEDPNDIEINDSFETAAEPILVDQFGTVDSDNILEDNIRTRTEINGQGEPEAFEYRPVYEYPELSQLDDDWYKFTVDTGGAHAFYAAITFDAFQADLDLFLYDDSKTLLESSEGVGSVELLEIQSTGRQTYYLRVVGEDLGTPYSMLVRGFFDDIYEENDSLEEAYDISDRSGIPLLDLVNRDEDWFRVDVPRDQVHLYASVSSPTEFMNIEVFDGEGNQLPGGYNDTRVISPEGGTYYLRVTGSNEGASYELDYSYDNLDEYEGNDTPQDATNLTRFRLEPPYNPENNIYEPPIKEFGFDYGLLSNLYFSNGVLIDPFGHAIQESEDWYAIKIPSWFLASARRGNNTIQVLKRDYYFRLSAEIEFAHLDGNIDLEIYDETDLSTPLGRSASSTISEGIESLTVAIDPTQESLTYYIRVYGDDAGNDYSLKWDVSKEDAYEQLEDEIEENDTNNFVDLAFDLTNADGESTEQTWLHEIEYLQDVNGDGIIDAEDGGIKSTKGYGMQRTDDWYAIVVSEGATQLEVDVRSWSDNDTGYIYGPDDLDIDFEVYFLSGSDGDPDTRDKRKPVLIGRSTEQTDQSLFSSAGIGARGLSGDITTEISEAAVFDVDGPGIYLIRIYYDNRSHPYTFYWDDIGANEDSSSDAAIIEDYLNGNWSYDLPDDLPSVPLVEPNADPDGDGFQNYVEYALGMDPSLVDYAVIGQSIGEIDGKRYYQFEFIRNREAAALGYEFIVQESDDLSFGSSEAVYVTDEDIPGKPELERVIYRCSKPMDEQDKCFFRLVVNEPPASKEN